MVGAEPIEGISVALAEIAGRAGGHQIGGHRQPTTGHRPHVVERVGNGAAVGAAMTPGIKDPAAQPGLAFTFRHQLCPVDAVAIRHGRSVVPTHPRPTLPDPEMHEALRRPVAERVRPLLVAPVLYDLD